MFTNTDLEYKSNSFEFTCELRELIVQKVLSLFRENEEIISVHIEWNGGNSANYELIKLIEDRGKKENKDNYFFTSQHGYFYLAYRDELGRIGINLKKMTAYDFRQDVKKIERIAEPQVKPSLSSCIK